MPARIQPCTKNADWGMELRSFLRQARARISPLAPNLGPQARLPLRHGRIVSQEELAECIGVSRVWYAKLEAGIALRPSTALLDRLATALMLNPEERRTLFNLAVTELKLGSALSDRSIAVLDAFGTLVPLRTAARRLWSATSESEILLAVAEAITSLCNGSDVVGAQKRARPGQWDFPVFIGGVHLQTAIAEMVSDLLDGMTEAEIDETMLYGVLTQPGQIGTRHELHRRLTKRPRVYRAFASHGFETMDFIDVHIRSREGAEATAFAVYVNGQKDFSELDRALLETLGCLASLALSQ